MPTGLVEALVWPAPAMSTLFAQALKKSMVAKATIIKARIEDLRYSLNRFRSKLGRLLGRLRGRARHRADGVVRGGAKLAENGALQIVCPGAEKDIGG
jgi:hypothetical protein